MIFQLLTPVISIVFAICFLAIYLYDKSKRAPAILAIAYACGSTSLIIDIFRDSFDPASVAIVTTTLYTATLFLTITSLAVHFRIKAPTLLMTVISIFHTGIILYFIYVQPDITIRAVVANTTAAGLIACALLIISPKDKLFINRLLFWIAAAASIQFILRAIFIFFMAYHQGYHLTDANYSQSIIIISLHFSIAILSLILAVTTCIAFGIDAISDIKKTVDTDILSGLLNRIGFETKAKEIIASAQAKETPVSLVIADLDKFKAINDKFGHIAGDEVIHEFGKLIRTLTRNGDVGGRISGKGFCILLQSADINFGRLLAESIRQGLETHSFSTKDEVVSLTASFGVAESNGQDSYNGLFARADEELYRAKNSG